jgi:hypothetical protein
MATDIAQHLSRSYGTRYAESSDCYFGFGFGFHFGLVRAQFQSILIGEEYRSFLVAELAQKGYGKRLARGYPYIEAEVVYCAQYGEKFIDFSSLSFHSHNSHA